MVHLLLHEFRVCQLCSHVTIIGEQEYTSCIAVEASYRVYSLLANATQTVEYSLAFLWVVNCGNAVFGLVEQNINLAFWVYSLTVETYIVIG